MKTLIEQIREEQQLSITKLIKWAGTKAILARSLGTTPQVVGHWAKRGRIAAKYAVKAETLTKGYLTKEQLRPDVINWEK